MRNKEQREYACLLYTKHGLTLKDIAEKVGVHPNTITKWRKKDNWDAYAEAHQATRLSNIRLLHDQLHQLNSAIKGRDDGQRFPTKAEADTQTQLSRSIQALEKDIGLKMIVDVFQEFLEYTISIDPQLTKKIVALQDSWIQSRLA